MEKKIRLKSRERINNWLEPYGENSYLLRSELDHIRVGRDKENKKVIFIDPPGGPFITIGDTLDEVGREVKSIDAIEGKGFSIIFK